MPQQMYCISDWLIYSLSNYRDKQPRLSNTLLILINFCLGFEQLKDSVGTSVLNHKLHETDINKAMLRSYSDFTLSVIKPLCYCHC